MATSESLLSAVKIVNGVTIAAGASAATPVSSAIIDMTDFEHVLFIVPWGPITAGGVQSIKIEAGDASDLSDAADITDTSVAVADDYDNKIKYVELLRPGFRYVRLVITRGTQVSTCAAIAILHGAHKRPATQPADVTGESHKDKIAGTA